VHYITGYFHNVGFSTMVCPGCAPGIGGTTQIGGGARYKKKLRRSLCPQLQNRVGAYGWNNRTSAVFALQNATANEMKSGS